MYSNLIQTFSFSIRHESSGQDIQLAVSIYPVEFMHLSVSFPQLPFDYRILSDGQYVQFNEIV